MKPQRMFALLVLVLATALLIAACSPSPPEPPAAQAPAAEEMSSGETHQDPAAEEEHSDTEEAADTHDDGDMHNDGDMHEEADSHSPEDHMSGMSHNVPEEAAAVPNPLPATDENVSAGAEIYATNCAICHGETGAGDGPASAGLEKPPANLHAGHVQSNSDGALFYIISHGRPETPMPAWENVLTEEQRWQVVHFLRTFKDEDHAEGDEHAADEHAADEGHTEGDEHAADEHSN